MRVPVLGLTFKENVPDIRNGRVVDTVRTLASFGAEGAGPRSVRFAEDALREHEVKLNELAAISPSDAVVLVVAHRSYIMEGWSLVTRLLKDGRGVVIDVRGILDRDAKPQGIELWRL
jgi:UDP-N-acetyl-D-glucosamine/UDP-N-acetyl-D-galactosamine dehydrogenase